ncbi:MAG: hypothetical protein JNJ73_16990 [Hyphomonadaceae bacterium]|nr:hypothetical protein [Hyphomonadaceae bacterium]
MQRWWQGEIIAGILGVALVLIFTFDERARYVVGCNPCMTEGSAFGVRVGESLEAATARLAWMSDPVEFPERDPPTVTFRDRSIYNGVVTIYHHDGKVVLIGWSYHGPFYVDF